MTFSSIQMGTKVKCIQNDASAMLKEVKPHPTVSLI